MLWPASQILSVAQMRGAEQALIDAGSSVDALMEMAGRGAAAYIWRLAAHHRVTVVCGPGNNGGDGYVIAETLRERGGKVVVLAVTEPRTVAARHARALYRGEVLGPEAVPQGEIFVDCLFGSGLSRPLHAGHVQLLQQLAASHRQAIAVDLPSGVEADSGALLNSDLPHFNVTLALGAWKFAHVLMPASAILGDLRLVPLGIEHVSGSAGILSRPLLHPPAADSHKYRRGLLAVVSGDMPGAPVLACVAAQGAGAGYVKLLAKEPLSAPADLVVSVGPLSEALSDKRISALLIGPGLGRDKVAYERLQRVLAKKVAGVLDADALLLLDKKLMADRNSPLVATPHEGELKALEAAFGCDGAGSKVDRARALSEASGMVIVAKGPDTVIAAPDGQIVCAPRASSWLSVAGTGDVLAGTIASRLAVSGDAFAAAQEGVWLHSEASRLAKPAFTACNLAMQIPKALAMCL